MAVVFESLVGTDFDLAVVADLVVVADPVVVADLVVVDAVVVVAAAVPQVAELVPGRLHSLKLNERIALRGQLLNLFQCDRLKVKILTLPLLS